MDRPLVSVLLPSLNARQFLDVRIESLLAQTFSNWEAVVLDSHSTDGSWEVFKSIRNGDNLLPADLIGHLTVRATENLLSLDTVRTSVPGEICRHLNWWRVFLDYSKNERRALWSAFVPASKCGALSHFLSRFLRRPPFKFESPNGRRRRKGTNAGHAPFMGVR